MAKGKGEAAAKALKGPFKKYMDKLLAVLKKPKKKGKVTKWEVGRYGDMKSRPGRDGMDMDHIPSKAALLKRAEALKGRPLTRKQQQQVINSGTAVAVPRRTHRKKSRTYGRRNKPEQIAGDARDPTSAAKKDFDKYRDSMLQEGYTEDQVNDVYNEIQTKNRELGY